MTPRREDNRDFAEEIKAHVADGKHFLVLGGIYSVGARNGLEHVISKVSAVSAEVKAKPGSQSDKFVRVSNSGSGIIQSELGLSERSSWLYKSSRFL